MAAAAVRAAKTTPAKKTAPAKKAAPRPTSTPTPPAPRSGGKPATRPATKSASSIDMSVLDMYEIHPAAALFPMIPDEDLRALADDIAQRGQIEPIVLWEGKLLDGRNRLVACNLAGVVPIIEEYVPSSDNETPTTYVMSRNVHRRHLSASTRAAVAVAMEAVIAEENKRLREEYRAAKKAEAASTSLFSHAADAVDAPMQQGRVVQGRIVPPAPQKQRPDSPFGVPSAGRLTTGRARDIAAKAMSVSPAYVNDAKDLARSYPDTFEEVKRGEKTLPQAQEEIISKARDEGTLEDVKLRDGAVRSILNRIEAKQYKKEKPKRDPIAIKKFGKVSSSRVTVTMKVTFGNPQIAEELLNKFQDDPRILSISVEPVE